MTSTTFCPFTRGSVGVAYMILLRLPLHKSCRQFSIRNLYQTPSKISTNLILDDIIADVVIGSKACFKIVVANGNDDRIVLEKPIFVEDNPASSVVV